MSGDGHLRKEDWEVRAVDISVARRLIEREHYAHGVSNTAVYVHGLFRKGEFWEENCQEVAWWLPPPGGAALATYPENSAGVLSLSRLAIRPEVPCNGASFLVGRSMKMIDRHRFPCLVTYADGMMEHTGAIYRATNWQYVGLTQPERAFSIKGKLRSRKAGAKTRTVDEMLALGAVDLGSFAKHKFVHIVARG